jgi:hypothetical protein
MTFPGLGGSVRSKCCRAVVRLGYKKIPKTDIRVKLWICTLCKNRDVDIISLSDIKSQTDEGYSSEPGVDEAAL